jgi:hypothetical protein
MNSNQLFVLQACELPTGQHSSSSEAQAIAARAHSQPD